MNLLYIVRCNFSGPAREAAFNDWYSGPKLKQMLAKPYFLSVQRFLRAGGEGRNYVAFWVLSSPEAFETFEYKSDWGFFEWRPYIIDWSRDLFERLDGGSGAPMRLGDGELLRVVSFEGLDAGAAEAARRAVDQARPGTIWHRSAGLDRHTPLFGVSKAMAGEPCLQIEGVVDGVYRPISELVVTDRAEASKLVG